MSFAPSVPLGGVGGWALLQRIEPAQREAFARRPDVARESAHFEDRISTVRTAEDLVADRRLLSVALGAFGLEQEIGKRALIRKALESDPLDPESFANRLVDVRYRKLAEAFGYGSIVGPKVDRPGFAAGIAAAYRDRSYEVALGESDNSLRLALHARRELAAFAASADPRGAAWFAVLGDRPTRAVFEGAFGLPASFGQLDVDRQRDEFRERTRAVFGDDSLAVFADPDAVETLVRRFLAREAATQGPSATTRGATALTLLGGGFGAGAARNLLLATAGGA